MAKGFIAVLSILLLSACVPTGLTAKAPDPEASASTETQFIKFIGLENPEFVDACETPEGTEGTICSQSWHNKENVGIGVVNKTRHVVSATIVIDSEGAATYSSSAMGRHVTVKGQEGFAFTVHPGERYYLGGLKMVLGQVKDKNYKHTARFEDVKLGLRYPDNHPEIVKMFGTKAD